LGRTLIEHVPSALGVRSAVKVCGKVAEASGPLGVSTATTLLSTPSTTSTPATKSATSMGTTASEKVKVTAIGDWRTVDVRFCRDRF
jgi:hypothetical protein